MGLGKRGDARLNFLERRDIVELDAVVREPAGNHRDVRIVEPRQHRAAARIDQHRLRTAIAHDLALASRLEDLVAADRDRLGHRPEVVALVYLCFAVGIVDRPSVVLAFRADDETGDESGANDGGYENAGEARGHGGSADSITAARLSAIRRQPPNKAIVRSGSVG